TPSTSPPRRAARPCISDAASNLSIASNMSCATPRAMRTVMRSFCSRPEPRRLPMPASERVIHFRTLDDYLALRRYAAPGAHIGVVGGGFIGSELAASLAGAGCKVTMLFPGESIGAGRFPATLAEFVDAYFCERGVELSPGVKV